MICLFVELDIILKEGKWVSHLLGILPYIGGRFDCNTTFQTMNSTNIPISLCTTECGTQQNQNFVCPWNTLVHPAPEINSSIDFRYSSDPLKAVSGLSLVPSIQAIFKFNRPSSLDYRSQNSILTGCVASKLRDLTLLEGHLNQKSSVQSRAGAALGWCKRCNCTMDFRHITLKSKD